MHVRPTGQVDTTRHLDLARRAECQREACGLSIPICPVAASIALQKARKCCAVSISQYSAAKVAVKNMCAGMLSLTNILVVPPQASIERGL